MTVERRELRFQNLDQALAEIESLASGTVRTTGSFSFGQIVEHLARTIEVASGHRTGPKVPLLVRVIVRLMRPFILSRPVKPGLKLPSNAQSVFWPSEDVPVDQAVQHFREALAQYQSMPTFPTHPLFGKMTKQQNDILQCGHCAMHLSFVHPA